MSKLPLEKFGGPSHCVFLKTQPHTIQYIYMYICMYVYMYICEKYINTYMYMWIIYVYPNYTMSYIMLYLNSITTVGDLVATTLAACQVPALFQTIQCMFPFTLTLRSGKTLGTAPRRRFVCWFRFTCLTISLLHMVHYIYCMYIYICIHTYCKYI